MNLLQRIREASAVRLAARKARVSELSLAASLPSALTEPRFRRALAQAPGAGIIAEFKRRSPSENRLALAADPVTTARAYAEAGATALSILTDEDHFGGSLGDLTAVRAALPAMPLLRKDFLFDSYQILEAKVAGADAVLLILSLTGESETRALLQQARALKLDVLVEVHDEAEMETAIRLEADLIGVNNRNLSTLQTSLDVSRRLVELAPESALLVSESGIRSAQETQELGALGYRAFLVGTSLLATEHPGEALARLQGRAP